MDISLHPQVLNQRVRMHGMRAIEARQVATRLKELLYERYHRAKLRYQSATPLAAQVERRALMDAEYVRYLEELLELRSQAFFERIQYETHLMLVEARRSLQSRHRHNK